MMELKNKLNKTKNREDVNMALIKHDDFKHVKTPKFPDVPYSEYSSRINKAQRLMEENEIDCLVLWNQKNIRYYFGFQCTHWLIPSIQCAIGIIPVEGEPILVTPDFFIGSAEAYCWTRNIYGLVDPHQPKSQRELPLDVAKLVKELGYAEGNIGLEKGPLGCMYIPRPINDIEAFLKALPKGKFVDGDKVIWGCRMIKSPLEVDRIAKSVEAIAVIQSALVEEFRPGMSESDLSIIVQRKAAELGTSHIGDSIGLQGSFRASKYKEIMADIGVDENAPIADGDYIFFDMFYDYKGYAADNARMFQISTVTDEMMKMYELIFECEDIVEKNLKPGIKANELYQLMYEPIMKTGLPVFDMGGHGNGLDIHEPPSIDAWNEMELKEGMVLSIEPWVYESFRLEGGTGKYGIQNQFEITKDGCRKIDGLKREIIQVSHPIKK